MVLQLNRRCNTASQWCTNVFSICPVLTSHTLREEGRGGGGEERGGEGGEGEVGETMIILSLLPSSPNSCRSSQLDLSKQRDTQTNMHTYQHTRTHTSRQTGHTGKHGSTKNTYTTVQMLAWVIKTTFLSTQTKNTSRGTTLYT